jgi:hypothetical protein
MALAHEDLHRFRGGSPSCPQEGRHHGRDTLAEVVPIRPPSPHLGRGLGSMMTRITQAFASLRTQATPVGSPPLPPTSPVLRTDGASPDDAA